MILWGCYEVEIGPLDPQETLVFNNDSLVVQYQDLSNWSFLKNSTAPSYVSFVKTNVSSNDINLISNWSQLEKLELKFCSNINNLTSFTDAKNLDSLYISGEEITDISSVSNFQKLSTASFLKPGFHSIEAFKKCSDLQSFYAAFSEFDSFFDITQLHKLEKITLFDDQGMLSFSIGGNRALHTLKIDDCLMDTIHLWNLNGLTLFDLQTEVSKLVIENALILPRLQIAHNTKLNNLTLNNLPSLTSLTLQSVPELTDLSNVNVVNELKNVTVLETPIEDLTPLLAYELETLVIDSVVKHVNFSRLNSLDSLSFLSFSGFSNKSGLDSLQLQNGIEDMYLVDCDITSFNFLPQMRNIRRIYLKNLQEMPDLLPLWSCPRLEKVVFDSTGLSSLSSLIESHTGRPCTVSVKGSLIPESEIVQLREMGVTLIQ